MRPCPRCGAPYAACLGSRQPCRRIENGRLALMLAGAVGAIVIGTSWFDLRGLWMLLPAFLGAAVGLAASYDDGERR